MPEWNDFVPLHDGSAVGQLFPNLIGTDAKGDPINLCVQVREKPYLITISLPGSEPCEQLALYLSTGTVTPFPIDWAAAAGNINTKMENGTLGMITIVDGQISWEAAFPHDNIQVMQASMDNIIMNPPVCYGWPTFWYIDTDMTVISYSRDLLPGDDPTWMCNYAPLFKANEL